MNKKYLLPCRCGRSVPVESNLAGLSVSCSCGATIVVPSLRELVGTAQAVEKEVPRTASRLEWGPREATIFFGLVIVATAVGMAAYSFFTRPMRPEIVIQSDRVTQSVEEMTLQETFDLWESLRGGLRDSYHPDLYLYSLERQSYVRRMSFVAAIGIVGLLVAGVGMAGFGPARLRPSGSRARRASTDV